jgi:N-acetylated-alpha-linked acidic dipeptidase
MENSMRYLFSRPLLILCLAFGFMLKADAIDDKPLLGFSREGSVQQRSLEAQFDASLKKDNLREWMKRITARPHHLGSPYGKEDAEFIAAQFRSWGYETEIEQFSVLFPTPKVRVLEMQEPVKFKAVLAEPPLKEDSTSSLIDEQLPPYNAYSIDGDVTGQLVYVNYGVPGDYEILAEHGIDVKGKIVIARYGGSWRGIKPKVAAEHGAIGCIIYSDPRDDGYFRGDVYPKGGYRNEFAAQRGSVMDMPLYPGDPLTPGIGATKDAKRLAVKDAPTLTKIPVLPISYADAIPLLKALEGPLAPERWRGGLPMTYHLGPGPTKVHLKLEFDWKQAPLYNVIARLRGSERPDEWIIRGNHHDAWVCGAGDPVSGLVTLMEEARVVSELAKQGKKPKRTIVYAAWDGEEPALLGSTEWVETHAEELKKHAALYINTDMYSRGFLSVGGSHTLEKFVNEVAREVKDPKKKITVAERLRASLIVKATPEEQRKIREREDLRLDALGSGSDYTPFLQHLGIASLNIGFDGEESYGVYHSAYDSFDHFTKFVDPGFEYGIALIQTTGRAVLRSANADVLPFEFLGFADAAGTYLKEVVKLLDDLREETNRRNKMISDGLLEAVADPLQIYIAPKAKDPVPEISFAPLKNALGRLQESAQKYQVARIKLVADGRPLPREAQNELDRILMQAERALTRNEGLPRRNWFRHQIYAPGFYTGYGVKTLPGVREAIEQRNWKEASEQMEIEASVIQRFTAEIERATKLINSDSVN